MTQPEFLNHRKREHMQYVPKCRNAEIGTCTYNKFCWFIHDQYEYDKKIKIKNNEVVDKIGMMEKTSTNWCILVAKLNIPGGLNHHLQYPIACSIQNDRLGLEICQTLSFWIKMANRVWKGGFEEDVDKNAKNSSSLPLLPVDCLNSDQL